MREKQKPPHVTSHEVLHSFSIPDLRAVLAALERAGSGCSSVRGTWCCGRERMW